MTIPQTGLIGARAVGDGSYQLGFPSRVVTIGATAKSIPTIVRWFFLLAVFTFPFEAANLGFTSGSLSLARIAALMFFMFYLLYYGPFHKRPFPHVPPAMWWFLGYVAVFALNGFIVPEELVGAFFGRLFRLVQFLVLFWIASDLLKDAKTARGALLAYSVASAILAIGMFLQLPGFAVGTTGAGNERETALGRDPNFLSILMALAVVMLIGLHVIGFFRHFLRNTLAIVVMLPILVAMARTGSRTGLVALMIGLSVYLLPHLGSRRKMMAAGLAILGMAALVYLASVNPVFKERWEQFYYEGKTSRP